MALDSKIKQSYWGSMVGKEIRKKYSSAVGATAPDFTALGLHARPVSLSSIISTNQYVLLDFWASWCVPCRKSFPEMRSIYQKHSSSGFEIVSITLDLDEDQWKRAVVEDSISQWKHIRIYEKVGDGIEDNSGSERISDKYYINGIPLQLLIDQNGAIIKRWTGFDRKGLKELSTLLDTSL